MQRRKNSLDYLSTVTTKLGLGDRKRQDTTAPWVGRQLVRQAWVQILLILSLVDPYTPLHFLL